MLAGNMPAITGRMPALPRLAGVHFFRLDQLRTKGARACCSLRSTYCRPLSRLCGDRRRSRRGCLLATSFCFCRGSSTWLLSPGFDHRRTNCAYCLRFCSPRTWSTGHARLSGARFFFERLGGCRISRQFRGTGLRIRSARSSRLWRTSVFQPLGSERSCHAHLLGR